MEEDREFKHVCRFCSKRFSCGRSLGGHMRSHMIFINNNSADVHELAKKRLSSAANSFISTKTDTEIDGYVLRDNPKKSKKLADSSEDTSRLYEKFSKERGKGFLSWKPLFGSSMKCNSEKERASNNTSVKDQDSWTIANQNKQLVTLTDSQSGDEVATRNRRRRSKRRTRYMAPANSSSFSVANNNGSSSTSKFEIEQEEEEVAMCLMMLSRDVGPRGVFNSLVESSDKMSVLLESEIEDKNYVCKKKLKEKKLETGFVDSVNYRFEQGKTEFAASGISRKGSKGNKIQVSVDLFDKNDTVNYSQLHYQFRTENSEVELGNQTELDQTQLVSCKNISSKKKIRDSVDTELASDSLKKSTYDASGAEFNKGSHNRSRFECAACNKIFHSYQGLGGHRASHKKIKGCFASKFGHNSENSIETQLSHPTADLDSKQLKSINNENPIGQLAAECDKKAEKSYVVKKSHECPICLKVFPSGQALGGHKRSHLLGGTEARNINPTPTIVIENPIPEIRNFIDLNLPATDEEDNNGHLGLKAWWISSINKHEALVGLISNRSHF